VASHATDQDTLLQTRVTSPSAASTPAIEAYGGLCGSLLPELAVPGAGL